MDNRAGNWIAKALGAIGLVLLGIACVALPMAAFKFGLLPPLQALLGLGPKPSPIVSPAGMLVAMVLGYWAYVHFIERRAATELKPRPLQTLFGIALGIGLIGVPILVLYALGNYQLLGFRGFAGLTGVVPTIIAAAVVEEIVFRALLFTIVERRFGFVAAVIVQSVAFAVPHLFNAGFGGWIDLVAGILIGALWACLYALWHNLWTISLHHAVWNLTIIFTGLSLSGLEDFRAAAPFKSVFQGPVLLTGGEAGPEPSLVTLGLIVIALGLAFNLVRQRQNALALSAQSN